MKKEKRVYCDKCKEPTFRTPDENVIICQGCGTRSPRKRVANKMVPIDSVPEELLAEQIIENSSVVEDKFEAVMGRMHKLSEREKEVIELLGEGKTQHDVAEILAITRDEVNTYLKRARIKLV